MRTLLVLIVGIVIGAFGFRLYERHARAHARPVTARVSESARSAADDAAAKTHAAAGTVSDTLGEKIREWHLTPDDIRADLAKSGEVVRQNAERARETVSDVRIVAEIKAKLLLDRDLSVREVAVHSDGGDVTLTGRVASPELIGRAVALALDTTGVHHVTARLTAEASSP